MKPILKFLARLYPSEWHKRYGTEFDALLEDGTPRARDVFDVFWGAFKMQITRSAFVKITLACSLAGILVAAVISFAIPTYYVSQGLFTATPANESTRRVVDDLGRNAFSREFLTSVIQEQNLYSGERTHMPLNQVIDKMQRNIHLHPMPIDSSGKQDAFNFVVQFDYSDPHVAQKVTAELVSRVIEANFDAAIHSHTHSTLRVPDYPSLPLTPAGLNRAELVAVGLFVGLAGGLILASVVRPRRSLQNQRTI
jgi:hypothetical protein